MTKSQLEIAPNEISLKDRLTEEAKTAANRDLLLNARDYIEMLEKNLGRYRATVGEHMDSALSKPVIKESLTTDSYVTPDGYSVSRNHDGDGLLLKDGKVVAVIKDLLKSSQVRRALADFSQPAAPQKTGHCRHGLELSQICDDCDDPASARAASEIRALLKSQKGGGN